MWFNVLLTTEGFGLVNNARFSVTMSSYDTYMYWIFLAANLTNILSHKMRTALRILEVASVELVRLIQPPKHKRLLSCTF